MPIEIRELIIKTEIAVAHRDVQTAIKPKDLALLKRQLLMELKKIMVDNGKRDTYKR